MHKLFKSSLIAFSCGMIGSTTATKSVSFSNNTTGISVEYEQTCTGTQAQQIGDNKNASLAEIVANHINHDYTLPEALKIGFICGEDDGPYYDPEIKTVALPYAFRNYIKKELINAQFSDVQQEIDMAINDVVLHTLYHEIGHALVDILDLPITGKEEDAVDELSTILILQTQQNGESIATTAGDFFDIEAAQKDEFSEQDLFGVHSLDEQRFFNIICLVYGEDPDNREHLLTNLSIDDGRAEQCIDDYEKRSNAWAQLLSEYYKH